MDQPGYSRTVLVAFLLVVFMNQPTAGLAQPQKPEPVREARREVQARSADYRSARARLLQARADLMGLVFRVSQATVAVEGLEEAIAELEGEITRSEEQEDQIQQLLNERARVAYLMSPGASLESALDAGSLADFSRRVFFLDMLSRADAEVADAVEEEHQRSLTLQGNLTDYKEEYGRLRSFLVQQRRNLVRKLHAAAAAEEEAELLLDEAEGELRTIRQDLRRQTFPAGMRGGGTLGPPVSADGPLYWCPVDPPRAYVDTFGAPRSGGRTHQGNDIFAPEGSPIRAPFAGRAEESSNTLGGLSVHVYSPGGDYVYNAHLSRYAGVDGRQVEAGDVVGFVGNTGNASGSPPHDHFEYHPNGGSAVSPYLYLNEVCGVDGQGP